jgi:hypothetical protein
MRYLVLFFCLLLVAPAWAKDSASQSKTKLRGFLDKIQAVESQARPIEPMFIPNDKRSRNETKEVERRIRVLDDLQNQKSRPLGREISEYQMQVDQSMGLPHQAVREAYESLDQWLTAKLAYRTPASTIPVWTP